jgi:hypothetical protein
MKAVYRAAPCQSLCWAPGRSFKTEQEARQYAAEARAVFKVAYMVWRIDGSTRRMVSAHQPPPRSA